MLTNQNEEYGCTECADGVIYPVASNCDESRMWIERCDTCRIFEDDEDAAKALVRRDIVPAFRLAPPAGAVTPIPYAVPGPGDPKGDN
jgi:hypothetical protein